METSPRDRALLLKALEISHEELLAGEAKATPEELHSLWERIDQPDVLKPGEVIRHSIHAMVHLPSATVTIDEHIIQRLGEDEVEERLIRHVASLRDAAMSQSLIAAGWTPPAAGVAADASSASGSLVH